MPYSTEAVRVADEIARDIDNGRWAPGAQFPMQRELMDLYRCTRKTAQQAVELLGSRGRVVRRGRGHRALVPGSGTPTPGPAAQAVTPSAARSSVERAPRKTPVVRLIEHDIRSGRWAAGTELPSHAELARLYQRSRNSIGSAIVQLAANGLIIRRGTGNPMLVAGPGVRGQRTVPEVVAAIKHDIKRGRWHVGDELPGRPRLAKMYRTSVHSAGKALDQLADDGLVTRPHQGQPTLVGNAHATATEVVIAIEADVRAGRLRLDGALPRAARLAVKYGCTLDVARDARRRVIERGLVTARRHSARRPALGLARPLDPERLADAIANDINAGRLGHGQELRHHEVAKRHPSSKPARDKAFQLLAERGRAIRPHQHRPFIILASSVPAPRTIRQLADAIRADIITGRWPAGRPLSETELADAYAVPEPQKIHSALVRLHGHGLVTVDERAGSTMVAGVPGRPLVFDSERLAEEIRQDIGPGRRWRPNQPLPGRRELAAIYGSTAGVAHHAVRRLVALGLVEDHGPSWPRTVSAGVPRPAQRSRRLESETPRSGRR